MTDLELLLAQAMCGRGAPCRYHVAQAKVAINALAGAEMAIVSLSDLELAEEAMNAQPVAAE